MRNILLATLLCASSLTAASDSGVRAFFGLRSCSQTLTKIDRDIIYVHAIARFEKGKFLGFDQAGNGEILGGSNPKKQEATFEIVWGKKNDQYGFAFIADTISYDFKVDPIYEHLSNSAKGDGAYAFTIKRAAEFKGMKVLTWAASSSPKDNMAFGQPNANMEENLKDIDFAVVLLFKECSSTKESIDFLRKLKNQ
jgi:hypothetical protein